MKTACLKVLAGVGLSALVATQSLADDFPNRTVETIFPWAAGNAMAVDQLIAKAVGDNLGVPVTIVSTPGAGGTKAFKTALARPADGYTLISGWVAPLVGAPVKGTADWTYRDFIPLHSGASTIFSIGLRVGDERFPTFMDLVEYGRANPGKLRYSSGAAGNLPHMVMAKTLQAMGVVAQNVPYNTDGAARKDLQAGVLDFAFVNVAAYQADKDGYNIGLVLSELPDGKAKYDGAPNIVDLGVDLGISGLGPMGWDWWLVHKDTPAEQVEILRAAMSKAMQSEELRQRISDMGWTPLAWDHDQYDEIVGSVAEQLQSMGDALEWEKAELQKVNG